MTDEFLIQFGWLGDLLKRPGTDVFEAGSPQQAIIDRLRKEWGTRDTAGLLRELTAQHGELAGRTVERFLEVNVARDWAETGKKEAHPGTEIDDFIRLLWEPLAAVGFEYTVEKDERSATFHVTRCPVFELARRAGLQQWCYHMACSTDFFSTPAFSGRIEFSRNRTLMQGSDCCDHTYRYRPDRAP